MKMDATFDSSADLSADEPVRPSIFGQLWQKRLVVALTFGVTLFVVIGLLFVLPVSYLATGSIIVADREPIVGSSSPAYAQKVGDPADMESTILLIRSPRLLRMLIGQTGIGDAIEADCAAVSRQLVNRFRAADCSRLSGDADAQLHWAQDRFSVGAVGRSRVITIAYKSPVPEVAQAMVNGLLQTFLDDEHTKLRHSRDEAVDWVHQRLSQLDSELQRDAASIEAFRNLHGLVRGVGGPLSSERLTQAAQQLSEARAAQAEAELRMQEARGGASSRQALDSRPIADLKQQLAQASALASSAAQRLGAQNPMLLAYRRQEADITARLAGETARVGEAARRNLDAAKARVDDATRELTSRTAAASQAAEAETQIASMVRDLEIKRGSYVDLSQRLSVLETERRILEPGTQLVNLAELPPRPAFPQRTPFLIGGLTMAAVLATSAGLLTYKPVQSGPIALGRTYTRIPILAQVPELRLRRTGSKKELVGRQREFPLAAAISLLDSHPPLLEAMRILYARLTLAGFGGKFRSLMVASEVAGEGKSFVTLALARMAQASGHRVLVIETCLREPFFQEALHGPPTSGLAGYLRGGQAELVQLGAVPGVDFLLAGNPMMDSTELLSGPRFRKLLEWADSYDLVLIDSAPVSELMDAALLAPRVDGVVFCLRAGRPPASQALNSLPEMQRANGNVVGLTLTFVPDESMPAPTLALARKVSTRRELQAGHA
jgi:succinoglycan biosynthesis transport protein ExoP